jgi:hypothetical protein
MPFDTDAFRNASLESRTESVRVPELSAFFSNPEEPIWTVRAVTANEVFKADAAKAAMSKASALADALTDGGHEAIVKAVKATLGRTDDVQPETARRLELLVAGSVDPQITLQDAIRIADLYPTVFIQLSNAVLKLTGAGATDAKKKPIPSGETPASAPPSP